MTAWEFDGGAPQERKLPNGSSGGLESEESCCACFNSDLFSTMLRNQSIFTSHEDNTTPSKTQQGRFSVSARRSSTAASRADPEAADAGRLARPATLCINTQRSSLYRAMIWPAATCAVRCMIGLAVAPRMRTSQGAQRSASSPLTEARSSTCDTLGRWIGRWTVAVADSRSSSIGGKDFEP